ncbi:hypothetical protein VP01_166g1 [Puccinia sorghi]|uniref:Uncharacterized protein n=1 Tax=Puccinia sorghi TaxID=27349 RepID=A0A0L6VG77_9BASI|nr:hypothetical protein VP01_166g1 [Puccinia sorghi]
MKLFVTYKVVGGTPNCAPNDSIINYLLFLCFINATNTKPLTNASRRQQAKCNHCQKVFNQGKPHLLFSHITDSCPNIHPKEKSYYLSNVLKADSTSQDTMESSDEHQVISVSSRVSSNVPFTYLKNPYFQEYQLELVRSQYKLPHHVQIIKKTLPMVHAQNKLSLLEKLGTQTKLTLFLDG